MCFSLDLRFLAVLEICSIGTHTFMLLPSFYVWGIIAYIFLCLYSFTLFSYGMPFTKPLSKSGI